MKRRAAILISSNMAALIEAARPAGFSAEITLVLADRPEAPGLVRAAAAGTPNRAIDYRAFGRDRAAHEAAIDRCLTDAGVEVICLAGYMRVLTPLLVRRWAGRMLNIHPSLLPAFPGLDTHARALAAGVKLHGCTVHLVTEAVDEGPILAQAAVPVLPGDTAEALTARVLAQEHVIYPLALASFAGGAEPRRPDNGAALLNPLPLLPPLP